MHVRMVTFLYKTCAKITMFVTCFGKNFQTLSIFHCEIGIDDFCLSANQMTDSNRVAKFVSLRQSIMFNN